MTQELVFANAQLVMPDETFIGAVQIKDGLISAIDRGCSVVAGAIDCAGEYLAPGLIELHTDNLERHIQPRAGVSWPLEEAILAHDAELAGTGITTVFDAVRVGSIEHETTHGFSRYARKLANNVLAIRAASRFKISHQLHLRAEICSETLVDEMDEFTSQDHVGIVSLMDHTPGQRQFTDIVKFKEYICGKYGLSEEEFDKHKALRFELRAELGAKNEAAAVAAARRYGATLASHDDATALQVAISHRHGVTLAEFPTTKVAAEACEQSGISVIMGAPNLVQGRSHSGNVSAQELAEAHLLDILSSDYVPASLLFAALRLGRIWDNIPKALLTVTANPAAAVGLKDRGSLEIAKRADLIRFVQLGNAAGLRGVWVQGQRVS